MRSTTVATPDRSTPAPSRIGRNTDVRDRPSHSNRSRGGGALAAMGPRAGGGSASGRDRTSSRRCSTLDRRRSTTEATTAISAATKITPDTSARFHCHRYR
jgi:hypothetical protein